jgi:uncharacterized membrane protein YedE/YeeE
VLELFGEPATVLLIGAGGGLALGLAARLGKLCTLGMIEDVHYGQDYGRLWMWLTALGTAMLVNFGADALGFIDLSATLQLSNRYSILGGIVGGLLFGYGMAQAGNCGYGVLARLGGGDIRALMIAIVMGITASAAIFGVLDGLRPAFFPMEPADTEPVGPRPCHRALTGLSHTADRPRDRRAHARRVDPLPAGGATPPPRRLGRRRRHRHQFGLPRHLLGRDPRLRCMARRSHSFTAPIGETIHYAMFSSGLAPKFGMGSVLGVIVGGAIGSFIQDGFRWEACEDPRELRRQMGGAVAMGLGAVLAAGCSVGQGLSALSLLSTTAPIVAASIWIGAWIGLRHLIFGLEAA